MTIGNRNIRGDVLGGIIGGLVVILCLAAWSWFARPPVDLNAFDVTPEELRFGLAPESFELTEEAFAEYPQAFGVEGGREDNRRRNVRLWEPLIRAKPNWRNVPQPLGDCVAAGLCHCLEIVAAARNGEVNPFRPYTYGLARVTVGKGNPRCGSDGAIASFAIKGFKTAGWLEISEAPAPYSQKIGREWGCKGPPANMIAQAVGRSGDAYPIRSVDELIDALANGFPCTIASQFGVKESTITKRDGRWVGDWNSSWAHQMAFVGYDGTNGPGREYVYVLNSWGDAWPPSRAPLQNEIKGGFWVTLSTAERMVTKGECWAISDVTGFVVPNEIDWSVFDLASRPASLLRAPAPTTKGKSDASLALAL
jgi:hypothetical protein